MIDGEVDYSGLTREEIADVLRCLTDETLRYRRAAETLRALVAREPMSHAGRVRWLVADAARRAYDAHLAWLEHAARMLAGDVGSGARRADPLPLRRSSSLPPERREAVA